MIKGGCVVIWKDIIIFEEKKRAILCTWCNMRFGFKEGFTQAS